MEEIQKKVFIKILILLYPVYSGLCEQTIALITENIHRQFQVTPNDTIAKCQLNNKTKRHLVNFAL